MDDEFSVGPDVFVGSATPPATRVALRRASVPAMRTEAAQRRYPEPGADHILGESLNESDAALRAEYARWDRLLGSR